MPKTIPAGTLNITSGKLFLSDMRLGPSEDGCLLEVAPGAYEISSYESDEGQTVYRVIKNNTDLRSLKGAKINSQISSEMCLLGCFDLDALLQEFGDFESLYEWGDDRVNTARAEQNNAVFVIESPIGSRIFCLPAGSDETEHDVTYLYSGQQLVGFEVYIQEYVNRPPSSNPIAEQLFEFEFIYDTVNIEVSVSTVYDEESMLDEIKDAILDFMYDDSTRINQLMNASEPELKMHTPLGDLDQRLTTLQNVKVYSVNENDEKVFLRSVNKEGRPNESNLSSMLTLILKNINPIQK